MHHIVNTPFSQTSTPISRNITNHEARHLIQVLCIPSWQASIKMPDVQVNVRLNSNLLQQPWLHLKPLMMSTSHLFHQFQTSWV